MDIKNTTRIRELIQEYPQLQLTLGLVLPAYGELQQHQLKESVLTFLTVEHVAQKSGQEVNELIQALKTASGNQIQEEKEENDYQVLPSDPAWVRSAPSRVIDGVELLSQGKHPLVEVQSVLEVMSPGEAILLKTNFHPQPMIENIQKMEMEVHSREDSPASDRYYTFIRKPPREEY